jgi:hypothetical protein
METVYHTKIEVSTIAKNGSERFGANAECKVWSDSGSIKMVVSQHGKTKEEAEQKLISFLSVNGSVKTLCVEE